MNTVPVIVLGWGGERRGLRRGGGVRERIYTERKREREEHVHHKKRERESKRNTEV